MSQHKNKTIRILDTTLRDGNQAPGVSMGIKNRIDLARRLFRAQVDEIEAGIPASGMIDQNIIQVITCAYPEKRVIAWCRLKAYDIEAAANCGAKSIHICLPFSKYHLGATSHSWEDVVNKTIMFMDQYRSEFSFISIGLQDAFRADASHLDEMSELILTLPVDRIRISDTVGTAFPQDVYEIINKFTKRLSPKKTTSVEFHGHNDYGLATANSLAAVEAGADTLDVTVNGIGERAGNASLAEIVMNLSRLNNCVIQVDPERLYELSTITAGYSGREISEDKPFVGSAVFSHDSGIHVHGLKADPLAYQPLMPIEVGRG